MQYNHYHPCVVPNRNVDPPDEPDYWEESIPQWVATVSDASGTVFYTTEPDDDEDTVATEARTWISEHIATLKHNCEYEEYLEVLTELTDDRVIAHGTDPDDYFDTER